MTDWPDDWFRDGRGGPGGAGPGAAGVTQPAATPAAPPTGGISAADQLTQPGVAPPRPAQPGQLGGARPGGGWPAQPGQPGPGQPGRPAANWPAQPELRTPRGRPARPGQRPPGQRPPGLRPPGQRRTGWRRWLRPRPIALGLAVILSLAIIGSGATYFWLDSKLVKKNVLVNYAGRPAQGSGTTWLITGSDSRQGLTDKQIRKLSTGFDIGGQRSDTIMLVHVPAGGGRPVLMSIPRDSYVPIPGFGMNKINAAYSFGGPALLAKTLQNLTGLRIDHYMGIGFGGFVRVVDAIGGVRICLKQPLVDPSAGLHLHAGCQVLDGAEALGFVRSRHDYATQDLQRVQNQRLFLRALLRKLTSTGVILNPFDGLPAASGVSGALTVDKGTSLYQLLQVGLALKNPITTTAPIENANYFVNGEDAVQLNSAELAQLCKDLNTGKPVPKSLITGSTLAG